MPARTIAYLTSIYPRATDSFVRNEVERLRARGHAIRTFSIRRADAGQIVSEALRRERDATTYVLPDHLALAPLAALALAVRSPRRFAAALALAWRTHPPGLRGIVWQLAYLLEAAFLADRMLRDGIVHLHNHIGESSASVAMLASALSGIPYSLTIHGPSIFQAPERWALGAKIRRSAFTACISDFTRSQCMLQVPHTEWNRLHVVRCAPDAAFLQDEPPPPTASPRLVWVGRLSEAKAVPLLLAAARRLASDGLDFELVMVGDGPLRPTVEAELSAGLAGFVRLAGWLPAAEVKREIAQARALVMPSFAEGLPMVVMEALALGRPVVATAIAGVPELVESGVNGWLVPAGSCERLAAALREAVEAPPERLAAMGRAGRRAVERLHHPAREIEKLEALLLGSARSSFSPAGARPE